MLDFAIGFVLVATALVSAWFMLKRRQKKRHLSPDEMAALMRKDPSQLTLAEAIQRKIIEAESSDSKPF